MEFKLNKIDTDIRKKMQEEIKEDKVHSGKGISIKKDIKDEKSEYENNFKEDDEKRFITIDVIKNSDENVDVQVEKVEKLNGENSKGRILDTTK
ncbi:hypothetical protein [Clostridium beijerinckii]|uniref:hypothetical protein n=1 Tax=Clostridium beijerinckii TaxID=1520 RepID=UPI001360D8F8|nr:hypothetical protein [Clostridium beijerinckii]MZK49893.1 hypothetical protein [Clostridium beijerinckii]MZK57852.1 hypothetical protein [Clostridium beijerinckii]MZK68063.1 hypothetical protein [Clostridium beijerinckii]MZK73561.1 hypothetical protein [Clostridium beijerinckii]MZK83143.1 hypothetical protein [Clostridium beijerinckii]